MITCSISEDQFCVIDRGNDARILMVGWHEEENSFFVSVTPDDVKNCSFKLISKVEAMQIMREYTDIAMGQVLSKQVAEYDTQEVAVPV